MCSTCERLFFWLYPSNMKQAETEEGFWLRRMLLFAVIVHAGLAVWALAIIGFVPMILNLFQLAIAYSCYLTLREREVITYLFMIVVQCIYNISCLLGIHEHEYELSSMQLLGKMVSLTLCVILGYIVGKAYYEFRKSGGLHGLALGSKQPFLIEDQIADHVRTGVNAAENHINDALDRNEDEEYKAAR